ncbi:MAG: DUF4430 domain-containing protein [Ruminococcus sp.]
MKSLRKIAIALASALIILQSCAISAQALSADEIKGYIDSGLEYKYSSANTHNADEFVAEILAPKAGTSDSDWYVITMGRYGVSFNKSGYINALHQKLDDIYSNGISSVRITELQRMALAYSACGADIRSVSGHNLLADCSYMRSTDEMAQQGVLTLDYGLIVLDSENYNIPDNAVSSRENIISTILSLQLANGCFSADGKTPDADATAMTVTALAPYYENNKAVKASVDKALEQLSKMQKSDGTFACWGKSNCESTAQVVMCLSALGIDCIKDERFIKNSDLLEALLSFRKSSGGFSHLYNGKENSMATYQALYTLVGYRSFLLENQSLYNFSQEQDADKTLSGSVYAPDDKYNDENRGADESYRGISENSSLEKQAESPLTQTSENSVEKSTDAHNETSTKATAATGNTANNNSDINYIVRYKQGEEEPTTVGELSFYQLLHTFGIVLFLITVYVVLVLHKTQKQNFGGKNNKPKRKQDDSTINDISQLNSQEKELPKEKLENKDALKQNGRIKLFSKKQRSKFSALNFSAKKFLSAVLSVCIIVFLCSCSVKTPEEYYSENSEASEETVQVKIDCTTALDKLSDDLKDYIPTDGIIADEAVSYSDGDTAFSVLTKVTKSNKIQLDYTGSEPSVYVRGISNLYEFSCGNLSGWMVNINGNYIQTSASEAEVKPGDTVAWRYTCDLGADIGNAYKGE